VLPLTVRVTAGAQLAENGGENIMIVLVALLTT
jgi:hypothetical protein